MPNNRLVIIYMLSFRTILGGFQMIIPLTVKDQSVETSGITKDYKEALCEFIWNSFEAKATEVNISCFANQLSGIDRIYISDNGVGISFDNLSDTFGTLLASQKNSLSLMKSKTNKGKGRFSFTAICGSARWNTVFLSEEGLKKYSISLNNENKEIIECTEPIIVDDPNVETGTTLVLTNINKLLPQSLSIEALENTLLKEFAWFLYLNKNDNVRIIVNNEKVDYSKYINIDLSRSETLEISGYDFTVNLIVWLDRISEKYCNYYLDDFDNVKGKDFTTFNRNMINFNHSVFVKSKIFNSLNDISLDRISDQIEDGLSIDEQKILRELKTKIRLMIEKNLTDFVSSRADEEIEKMINERKTFPSFKDDKYDQIRRKDLIKVTKELYQLDSRIFYRLKPVQEKSLLGLLNLLLDSEERERILEIVEQIVELTPEQRENFAKVLKKTKLENIIEVMRFIEERYSKIEILKKIVYDYSRFANERDNVQRIVENNYWLFGEQYNLATADKTMRKSLQEYMHLLYGEKAPIVKLDSDNENERRMDIFMCSARRIENDLGVFMDENIIVELKAPKVSLSKKVLRQIEDYMDCIIRQPSFNSIQRRWKFIAVCCSVDDDVKMRYTPFKDKGKPGLVQKIDNYELYALSWDDIFESFNLRHSFILDKLRVDRDAIAEELINDNSADEGEMVSNLTEKAL